MVVTLVKKRYQTHRPMGSHDALQVPVVMQSKEKYLPVRYLSHTMNRVLRLMLLGSATIGGATFSHYLYNRGNPPRTLMTLPAEDKICDLCTAIKQFQWKKEQDRIYTAKLDAALEEECYQRLSNALCRALYNGKNWVSIEMNYSQYRIHIDKAMEERFKAQGLNVSVKDKREYAEGTSSLTATLNN